MKQVRIVLDTNILVAASRSLQGASFAVLQHLRRGDFVALASVPLFLEYDAVLKRPAQLAIGNRTVEMVDAFLDALSLRMTPVHLHFLWRPQTRDPADEIVLETALNGRADALVTFNLSDFSAANRFRLPVWAPSTLLSQLNLKE